MFILPQFQFAKWRTAIATAIDTYFKYTSLLLKGDSGIVGSNGPTPTFLDSSTNNFSITRNGSVAQTSLNPFGPNGWSGYFNSATSDYLSVADNSALELGSGDFTIEMWINTTNSTQYSTIFARSPIAFGSGMMQIHMNNASSTSGDVALWLGDYNTSSYLMRTSGVSVRDGNWHHLAVVRSGNSWAMYVDGVSRATNTWSGTIADIAYGWVVGNDLFNTPRYYTGSISNLRIVKGLAVYTGAFTPPTAQLASTQSAGTNIAAITGTQTSLLTLQDSRFKDNSGNNFTITRTGSPKIQPFSPFAASASYVAGTYGGSGSFSSAGTSYLSAGPSSSFNPSTGDFTIECWFNMTATGSYPAVFTLGNSTGNTWAILCDQVGQRLDFLVNGGVANGFTIATLTLNVWYHIALVKQGTTVYIYLNGAFINSKVVSLPSGSLNFAVGGNAWSAGSYWNGYVSNLRIVKGLAVYTGAFTPPTSPVTTTSNGGAVGNNTAPTATQTSLLLNFANGGVMDGANKNAITINSNVAQGSFNPYGPNGWSGYFSSSSYLSIPNSTSLQLGSSDFCIECWVNFTSTSGNQRIISQSDSNYEFAFYSSNGSVTAYSFTSTGTQIFAISMGTLSTNQWYHIACTRSGSNVRAYVNGSQVGSTATGIGTIDTRTGGWKIGASYTGSETFNGYISNARIVKGSSVYGTGSTIIVPTAPLTNIANTSLLTLQSNRFNDNSTNNFTLTPTGSPQIQPVSPFASGIDYSPTVYGGSAYFDGSSYLSVAGLPSLSTSNFTVECWVYLTKTTSTNQGAVFFDCRGTAASNTGLYFGVKDANTLAIYTNGAWAATGGVVTANTWNHVALVRNGANLYTYLNGMSAATVAAPTLSDSGNLIGYTIDSAAAYAMQGYISNFRIVKGTALYTSTFTPTTAPLSAVANTSLLLNFADGGVVDATGKNNVVTVSNAGVSLAQKKYGSGSYLFNGTSDYLKIPYNKRFDFDTDSFTVECWVYVTSSPATIVGTYMYGPSNVEYGWLLCINSSSKFEFRAATSGGGSIQVLTDSSTVALNTWYHIAVVRNGSSNANLYVNGVSVNSSTTFTNNIAYNRDLYVGISGLNGGLNSGSYYKGYIDDLRVTKGIARYTSNFTVPATHPTQ